MESQKNSHMANTDSSEKRERLARECAKLDPVEEKRFANEGMVDRQTNKGDTSAFPLQSEKNMRTITGAILILSAAVLIAPVAWLDAQDLCSFAICWLSVGSAAITSLLGLVYLFLGSFHVKEDARWYQYSM